MASNSLLLSLGRLVRSNSIRRLTIRTGTTKFNAIQSYGARRDFHSLGRRQPSVLLNRVSFSECLENTDGRTNLIVVKRFRQSKKPSQKSSSGVNDDQDEAEESDDDEAGDENPLLMEEESVVDGCEELSIAVNTLRLDGFAKVAFKMTRAKIEESFYKGNLLINGERPQKKSQDICLGDEIDFVKSVNSEDTSKIDVKRVQIVDMPDKASDNGRMVIGIKRWHDLVIEPHESKD